MKKVDVYNLGLSGMIFCGLGILVSISGYDGIPFIVLGITILILFFTSKTSKPPRLRLLRPAKHRQHHKVPKKH
jgi:hypothetical protein